MAKRLSISKELSTVTVPKFLYDSLLQDAALIRHLAYHRGRAWIEAVRHEMELDKKYSQGAFKKI